MAADPRPYGSPPPASVPPYWQQGGPAGAANEPNAVMAMVLGILGLTICGLAAPFAWGVGKRSLEEIRRAPGQWAGEGMAQAGYIMGIVGTCLLVAAVLFLLVYFLFVAAVFSAAGT